MVLPLFHIFGLSFIMLLSVATGTQMVLHIRFDADRVLGDIARKKITDLPRRADHVHGAGQSSEDQRVRSLLAALCASGGAPLPVEVLQRFQELTGVTPRRATASPKPRRWARCR